MAKRKFYAFLVDGKQGITDNWPECQAIVAGKNGAKFKGFEFRAEATTWLEMGADYSVKSVVLEDGIYFDAGTGSGDGVEIQVADKNGKSFLRENLGHEVTNNYGELLACKKALELALKEIKNPSTALRASRIFGDSKLVVEYWSKGHVKYEVGEETVNLAHEVKKLRKEFANKGGHIKLISGGNNPADLGFHKN